MSKDFTITISRPVRIGEKIKRPKVVLKCIVQQQDDFTDTDICKMMFAIEFAANGHSELPLRVHIDEVPS